MKASQKTKTAVVSVLKQYWRAYEGRKIEEILKLLSPDEDSIHVGSGADEVVHGSEEFRAALKRDFRQSQGVKVSMKNVSVSAIGDAAWLYSQVRMKALTPEGGVVLNGRLTAVFEKRNERWLIAHSHFSVPNAGQGPGQSFPRPKVRKK